jgi:hypothetical protein
MLTKQVTEISKSLTGFLFEKDDCLTSDNTTIKNKSLY